MLRSEATAYRSKIDSAINKLCDKDSLEVAELFHSYESLVGTVVDIGDKFCYNSVLYKVKQKHTIQQQYVPGIGTESLYSVVSDICTGTINDPIPYAGNMVLEFGKYYIQSGVLYLCVESTGIDVYSPLENLPRYVKRVEE